MIKNIIDISLELIGFLLITIGIVGIIFVIINKLQKYLKETKK